jgi:hypothetical protein
MVHPGGSRVYAVECAVTGKEVYRGTCVRACDVQEAAGIFRKRGDGRRTRTHRQEAGLPVGEEMDSPHGHVACIAML